MNELIAVRQLPIIEERLKDLSAEIDKKVTDALALAVTPETLASVKKVRADLNKQYKELEEQRKEVKRKILEPYEKFDGIYKTYVGVRFSDADTELKRKINDVENRLKLEKNEDLADYFYELCSAEHLDWLEYERGCFNVTLSKSRAALHKEVDEFVGRISSDVTAIEVMPDAEEILVEYKRSLRLGEAVDTVRRRREAVEQAKKEREHIKEMRKAEKEAAEKVAEALKQQEEMCAPEIEDGPKELETDPVRTVAFRVTAPVSKLKALKEFLKNGGYEIG